MDSRVLEEQSSTLVVTGHEGSNFCEACGNRLGEGEADQRSTVDEGMDAHSMNTVLPASWIKAATISTMNYKCEFCGLSFLWKNNFKWHVRNHFLLRCLVCDSTFNQMATLRRHMLCHDFESDNVDGVTVKRSYTREFQDKDIRRSRSKKKNTNANVNDAFIECDHYKNHRHLRSSSNICTTQNYSATLKEETDSDSLEEDHNAEYNSISSPSVTSTRRLKSKRDNSADKFNSSDETVPLVNHIESTKVPLALRKRKRPVKLPKSQMPNKQLVTQKSPDNGEDVTAESFILRQRNENSYSSNSGSTTLQRSNDSVQNFVGSSESIGIAQDLFPHNIQPVQSSIQHLLFAQMYQPSEIKKSNTANDQDKLQEDNKLNDFEQVIVDQLDQSSCSSPELFHTPRSKDPLLQDCDPLDSEIIMEEQYNKPDMNVRSTGISDTLRKQTVKPANVISPNQKDIENQHISAETITAGDSVDDIESGNENLFNLFRSEKSSFLVLSADDQVEVKKSQLTETMKENIDKSIFDCSSSSAENSDIEILDNCAINKPLPDQKLTLNEKNYTKISKSIVSDDNRKCISDIDLLNKLDEILKNIDCTSESNYKHVVNSNNNVMEGEIGNPLQENASDSVPLNSSQTLTSLYDDSLNLPSTSSAYPQIDQRILSPPQNREISQDSTLDNCKCIDDSLDVDQPNSNPIISNNKITSGSSSPCSLTPDNVDGIILQPILPSSESPPCNSNLSSLVTDVSPSSCQRHSLEESSLVECDSPAPTSPNTNDIHSNIPTFTEDSSSSSQLLDVSFSSDDSSILSLSPGFLQ